MNRKTVTLVLGSLLVLAAFAGVAAASSSDQPQTTVGAHDNAAEDADNPAEDAAEGPDVPIVGPDLERASKAALDHLGEGRVTATEVGDEESYYEVEVTLDDGRQVDVQLNESFEFVGLD